MIVSDADGSIDFFAAMVGAAVVGDDVSCHRCCGLLMRWSHKLVVMSSLSATYRLPSHMVLAMVDGGYCRL